MQRIAICSDACVPESCAGWTTAAVESAAQLHQLPLLSIHAGSETLLVQDGGVTRLTLKRSAPLSCHIRPEICIDPAAARYARRVEAIVTNFGADVLHLTGPGDIGLLGMYLGRRLDIPVVASLSRPVYDAWSGAPASSVLSRALRLFYGASRAVLTSDLAEASFVERITGRPAFLVTRRSDSVHPTPKRLVKNFMVNIGYLGNLTVAANVRLLQLLETALDSEGLDVRFTIVGEGEEREWLARHMLRAEFAGALSGTALAHACVHMDLIVCPSEQSATGRVLDAMTCGVPVVWMGNIGSRFGAGEAPGLIVSRDWNGFVQAVRGLVKNRERREAIAAAARVHAARLKMSDAAFRSMCKAYDAAVVSADAERGSRCALSPA